MLNRGRSHITVRRPAPYGSDGAGGFMSSGDLINEVRGTVRQPSQHEINRAGLAEAQIDYAITLSQSADVQRQDLLVIEGLDQLEVMAVPANGIAGRRTKTALCKTIVHQHGEA